MWKAEKIELVKYLNCYRQQKMRLEINDVVIIDNISERVSLMSKYGWQCSPCDMCDFEGCSNGGYLQVRKQDDTLLFTPYFESMDGFEQYDYDKYEGEQECPPNEWYERGVLVIEKSIVKRLLELLPNFPINTVKELTHKEIDLIIDWEEAVRNQPTGFMVEKK